MYFIEVGQTDRSSYIMIIEVEFRNFLITFLSVKSTDTHAVHFQTLLIQCCKSRFEIPRWKLIILKFIAAFSDYTYYYVTKTAFIKRPNYYKLKNARWLYEYSVHKINPDVHFTCEVFAIMKVIRSECSLSDINSHSSRISTIRVYWQ